MLVGWRVLAGNHKLQGSEIIPPIPAADFELIDQNEQPFRLSDQQGKVVLIFFGYINCPDVCPVTLSQYKQIKQQLGERAEGVRFVFITVDPERDTLDRLKAHLENFDPAIVGLSGSSEALQAVYKNYGVYQAKQEVGSAAGYLVDHTSIVYAIDKQGSWRLTYPFGMETQKLVKDVSYLVREK